LASGAAVSPSQAIGAAFGAIAVIEREAPFTRRFAPTRMMDAALSAAASARSIFRLPIRAARACGAFDKLSSRARSAHGFARLPLSGSHAMVPHRRSWKGGQAVAWFAGNFR